MIFHLLSIIGIINYLIRAPKLKKRTVDDYPGVDPELYRQWHAAEVRSLNIYTAAIVGSYVAFYIACSRVFGLFEDTGIPVVIMVIMYSVSVVGGLILSFIAKALKKKAGIK